MVDEVMGEGGETESLEFTADEIGTVINYRSSGS